MINKNISYFFSHYILLYVWLILNDYPDFYTSIFSFAFLPSPTNSSIILSSSCYNTFWTLIGLKIDKLFGLIKEKLLKLYKFAVYSSTVLFWLMFYYCLTSYYSSILSSFCLLLTPIIGIFISRNYSISLFV